MSVKQEQIDSFLAIASTAAQAILKSIEGDEFIHVISHYDADGLAAAGIIGKALARLGGRIRIRVERWTDEKIISELAAENIPLIIFSDLGSGYLTLLKNGLSRQKLIILDHHQPVGEAPPNAVHVNPHLYGIDGSRDLSAAGVAYFVAKALDEANVDLAPLAVVGALGDMQDKYGQRELGSANKIIVDDAVKAGCLGTETDLMLFGRETRPIHKALASTTSPFLPGISGEEDKTLAFLASLGIAPKQADKWRAMRDLSEGEKKNLFSAIANYLVSKGFPSDVAMRLIGTVYTLTCEEPWTALRDGREFAVLLNATGRMDKPSLGVALCMGDRGPALEQSSAVLEEYRRTLMKYLIWLNEKPGRIEELDSIYVVRGGDFINEKVIGAVSSILSTNLPNPQKPIIAFSTVPGENSVKISARTIDAITSKGLNLGEIMSVAAEKYSGRGGGHDIAAGAQVPVKDIESFLKLVDE